MATTDETPKEKPVASPLLSAEDVARIKDEIILREQILNDLRDKKIKPESGWGKFLNSPFTITVIGGVVIALVGGWLQWVAGRNEKDKAYQQSLRDKKIAMLTTFGNAFDQYTYLTLDMGNKERWVFEHVRDKVKPTDEYGRPYTEIVKLRDEARQKYYTGPNARAMLVEIDVLFTDQAVHENVEQLRASMDQVFDKVQDFFEFNEAVGELQPRRDALLTAMAAEIKRAP